METSSTIGVLLMAYGSPEALDELEPYLLDIRGGRPVSPALLAEMKRRYALIGGRSPLLDLTRLQAGALETELNRRYKSHGIHFRLFVGMRHWQPRIQAAVDQMAEQQIKQVVAMVMAPHSSRLSSGEYFARLEEATRQPGIEMAVTPIESWYDHPGLIAALAEKASAALQLFQGIKPYVLFTAHSLPARILEQGDPYDSQLRQTASLLAANLSLEAGAWEFCYQSAGQSPEPWLGPSIEQRVPALAQEGHKNLLVVPVGFVCDHVEVLYDIDIAARKLAESNGARLERSASLNASPAFISTLADLISQAVATIPQP